MLQHSHEREAPEYVLRGLRAVDPRTHAIWWGGHTDHVEVNAADPRRPWKKAVAAVTYPVWLIGVKNPLRCMNEASSRRLRQLDSLRLPAQRPANLQPDELVDWCLRWRDRWRIARLEYQGFEGVFFWRARDLDWAVVTEYERMGWFTRHMFEIVQRAMLRELDKDEASENLAEREQLLRQMIRQTMPSIWRHVFRGRRSIPIGARAA